MDPGLLKVTHSHWRNQGGQMNPTYLSKELLSLLSSITYQTHRFPLIKRQSPL